MARGMRSANVESFASFIRDVLYTRETRIRMNLGIQTNIYKRDFVWH